MIAGLVLVLASHRAREYFGFNIRSPGLALMAVGLLGYAIYARLAKRLFGAMAATAFFVVVLWMLHEQMAYPERVGEWRPADTLGMLLAIGALSLGAYHEKQLRAALAELAQVQHALSTRYLGKFPHFIRTIVDEIARAEESVIIFCDVPAYGYFSDPRTALEYRQVLERKAMEGAKVELTCLDAATRREYESEQFAEATWARWQADHRKKERLEDFFARHTQLTPAEQNREAFISILDKVHADFLLDVFHRSAHEVALDIPVYFWIVDGRIAIFAISALSDKEGWEEYGFMTSDHALIQAFQEMRDRYRRKKLDAGLVQTSITAA